MAGKGSWRAGYETVSDFQMYCRDWRPAGEEAGLPVLALHGSRIQSGMWRTTAEGLARRRFVCPDQRGYGRSGEGGGRTLSAKNFARDAIKMADLRGLGRFVVMGHSFGAGNALQTAALAPKRVAAVVLVDVVTLDRKTRLSHVKTQNPGQPVAFESLAEAARYFRESEPGVWPARGLAGFMRDIMLYDDEDGPCRMPFEKAHFMAVRTFMASAKSDFDPFQIAPAVRCPVLIIRGGRSTRNTPQTARRLKDMLPKGSKVVTLSRSGHFPTVTEPQLFRKNLRAFLEKAR